MTLDGGCPAEEFGSLPDGRTVRRYTLGTGDGVQAKILDHGAVVQELWVPDAHGERANVVLGAPDLAGYLGSPGDYYGAVVGRFANRIADGRLPLDGTVHQLPINDGNHTLHGGPDGFHRRLWTVDEASDHSLTLSLVSPDLDQGFPGELTTRVRYVVQHDQVRIDYSATTTKPTAVNLTQHAHFNLAGESSGSVGRHVLQLAATTFTPVGPDLIPIGSFAPVSGTPLDFRVPRPLDSARLSKDRQIRMARGLDHNFVLSPTRGGPAAVLTDPSSGRRVEVGTDQPGMHVYTGNFFDGSHVGTGGAAYGCGAGVALETQRFPDAPNHEGERGWPSALLRPEQTLQTTTSWRFRATSGSATENSGTTDRALDSRRSPSPRRWRRCSRLPRD